MYLIIVESDWTASDKKPVVIGNSEQWVELSSHKNSDGELVMLSARYRGTAE